MALSGRIVFGVSPLDLIFETFTDLILQDYHNSKIFGAPFSLVYLTATLYPPLGQMSLNNNAENLILQQSNDSDVMITDNHKVNVSLVISDWNPTEPIPTEESTKSSV